MKKKPEPKTVSSEKTKAENAIKLSPKIRKLTIPSFVLKQYSLCSNRKMPYYQTIKAGILFLDVCSFTTLTEQATQKGHYGVEIITRILNSYFELLNKEIIRHGGEIVKYAGDAVLAVFIQSRTNALRAISDCMVSFQAGLNELNKEYIRQFQIEVSYHGSAEWGALKLCICGDPKYHFDFILTGSFLSEVYTNCSKATKNEVIMPAVAPRKSSGKAMINPALGVSYPLEMYAAFIPSRVIPQIGFAQFSGELRNTAILFIAVDLKHCSMSSYVTCLQQAYINIQTQIYYFDGIVNKIDYTDKGLVVLCSFGIPDAHLDDIERAVLCACQIVKNHEYASYRIGVTYSNVYSGFLGSKNKFEYGIIGNGVNIASRLMSEASENQIIISEEIIHHIEVRFVTQYLKQVKVKGIHHLIKIFYIQEERPTNHHTFYRIYGDKKLFAWEPEYKLALECLTTKNRQYVFVNGNPGTGKTFFVWQLIQPYLEAQQPVIIISLDEFNQATPFYLITEVFQSILQAQDPFSDFDRIALFLQERNVKVDFPLIRDYFGGVVNSFRTDNDQAFYNNLIFDQLVSLLQQLLPAYNLVFLDNIQWLDKLSLKLFKALLQKSPELTTNFITSSRYGVCLVYLDEVVTQTIELSNLDEKQSASLVINHLVSITPDAVSHIYNITKGNPLFIIEICKQVATVFKQSNVLLTLADLEAMERDGKLPQTIENLFINHFTTLDKDAQYILKLASIIGKAFTLNDILMVDKSKITERIIGALTGLDDQNIVNKVNIVPELEFIFTNNMMREAIYNTILLSEKTGLHNLMASHYESKSSSNYELIANHYILAQNKNKILTYAILAGDKNYRLANYEDSAYYYKTTLSYITDLAESLKIRLSLIDSYFFQGNVQLASDELEKIENAEVIDSTSNDKYVYLKLRKYYLTGEYVTLCEVARHALPAMQDKHFLYMVLIYYIDTLRALSEHQLLTAVLADFQARVLADLGKLMPDLTEEQLNDFDMLLDKITARESNTEVNQVLYYLDKIVAIYGLVALNQSQYAKSVQYYKIKLRLATFINDNLSIRIANHSLGVASSRMGKKKAALSFYEKARKIAEKIGDRFGYCMVIMDMGTLYRQAGDHEAAIQAYRQSFNMAEIIGNKMQQQLSIYNIGEIYYQEQRYDLAEESFNQAKAIAVAISDQMGISFANDALGDLYFSLENYEKAEATYRENYELQIRIEDKEGLAHTIGNLGNIARTKQDWDAAKELFNQNISLCQEVGDIDGEGRGWFNLAMIYKELSQFSTALEHLSRALKLFTNANSMTYLGMTHEQIADCTNELQLSQV